MSLRILATGPLALLEDLGRSGLQWQGLATGGPMDRTSHILCNRLLQNAADAATLEVHFGGLEAEVTVATTICVTGAELPVSVNGEPRSSWEVFKVSPGDRIAIAAGGRGCRAYLGVAGGFRAKPQFGSRATVPREQLGTIVKAGDVLPCEASKRGVLLRLPRRFRPSINRKLTLRLVPGYQYRAFSLRSRRSLYERPWTVSAQSDRMGCRIDGSPLTAPTGAFISEGIASGSVQVPPDGRPIILLQDRQTIGGYPKLGAVVEADLDRLAQLVPGGEVVFAPVSPSQGRRVAQGVDRLRHLAPLEPVRC